MMLSDKLKNDRSKQGLSLNTLAETMKSCCPTEIRTKRNLRSIVVWLNRIELGKLVNGPSEIERKWIAAALFPGNDKEATEYVSVTYEHALLQPAGILPSKIDLLPIMQAVTKSGVRNLYAEEFAFLVQMQQRLPVQMAPSLVAELIENYRSSN